MEIIIFHIDCNNAFLSWTAVSRLHKGYKEDIRKKYAVIGGKESERRGIVLAKSNPCKLKGVVTGETLYMARKKCPYLEVYEPDYKTYKKYSDIMYTYLCGYSKVIERYSIDECFVDMSETINKYGDPVGLAYKIKNDIKNNFGFTVNIGISNNKLLAKMASDFTKPDKVHTLFPKEIATKMWPLPVGDLFMIGKASQKRLHELGINTIDELAHKDIDYLVKHFKSMGKMMWNFANGIDDSVVETDYGNPKSVSCSVVLPYDNSNIEELLEVLHELASETGRKLRNNKMYTPNVNIWIKFHDFSKISKQVTLDNLINSDEDIFNNAKILFNSLWDIDSDKKIRALCVGVANLTDEYKLQLSIFNEDKKEVNKLDNAINKIKEKYGEDIINFKN